MRKTLSIAIAISFAILLSSCGTTEPARVQVIGAPEDLVPLTGEWIGTYGIGSAGRTGSITFHLTGDPEGAHGDVLMVAQREFVYEHERHPAQYPLGPQGMTSSSTNVLSIEFVRVTGGEISGRIAPYPDPESAGTTLETHFTGRVDGDWIEGTFVTYSDHGVSPRYGTWRVHRKSAS